MLGDFWDDLRNQAKSADGEIDEELRKFLSRGFGIQVGADGKFEILHAENLDVQYRNMLDNFVNKALGLWANPIKGDVASFSDVAQAYIEQHRFEHGDVDEYAHKLEISLSGGPSDHKVVSPEADKAQDEANQKVAGELGEQLRVMLDEEGVDTEGLEFEIDEKGKIKVLGDPDNAELRKAQGIIDQFTSETKVLAGSAVNRDENGENGENGEDGAEAERRRIRNGEDKDAEDGHVPDGYAKRDVEATGEKSDEQKWYEFKAKHTERIKPFLPDLTMKDPRSQRIRDIYVGWQRNMPKTMEGTHYISGAPKVSSVKAPEYASLIADGAEGVGLLAAAHGEDAQAVDKARDLYLNLLDGMTRFHDDRKNVKYRLAA